MMSEKKYIKCFVVLFALLVGANVVQSSNVQVIDGDSLIVDGVEIRLHGIDAPEYKQYCYRKNGKKYQCGAEAEKFLKKLLNGEVECAIKNKDRYKRSVAVCYAGQKDINRMMVRNGWAVAYTTYGDDYFEDEKKARSEKRGIWQGKFMRPEFFRRLTK